MEPPLVSIVIVTYNSKGFLGECLESIQSSPTKSRLEIIVVDNASTDGTLEALESKFPEVNFIRNERNAGFSSANNQGIADANGKYVLILNPDTVVRDDSIDQMVSFLESTPHAGACGSRLLNHDGSVQVSHFGFPTFLKELGHLLRIDRSARLKELVQSFPPLARIARLSSTQQTSEPVEVDYLLGACMMMSKSLLGAYGAMDDRIFMYLEDTEICHRLKSHGFSTYYLPTGEIIHYGGQSVMTADSRMFIEYTRSRVYFYRKAYGKLQGIGLKWIISVDLVVMSISLLLFGPQLEMQQLQTRYKKIASGSVGQSKPSRIKSLKLYFTTFKTIISM